MGEKNAQVLQSNDDSIADNELYFVVTVARNRSGGARLNLGTVPSDEILANEGPFLYNPKTSVEDNHLCFCLCLAHSANASMSDHQKLVYTKQLHSAVELDHMQRVLFIDVIKFENT